MDAVLKICINDGSDIIIDGFDTISFSNDATTFEIDSSAYNIQKEYPNVLNNLIHFNFIRITRCYMSDRLEYKDHSFTFENTITSKNTPFILPTQSITTIIDMIN
ncbi:hypothetical protein [Brochothrix campestris]|uniref:Uncharacterized protein n=1 Tax=Brochothrix campestris FSL F6-1037 TaxID=1265861 RepID=W7CYD8_9LIST|nr:hypothetical protein [Brochothrix campestris]EUJ41957.1 hypothetical protein BCAMP_01060 [Brochothrix campestris FSL F6-1037]